MKHLLDFQNVEKENLERIIDTILKLNVQKLKKIDSFSNKIWYKRFVDLL